MAHVHTEDAQTYYTDQLCTIAVCGALGGVAIMLYREDLLKNILAPQFFVPVLVSGIVLVVLAAIRAVGLWSEMGRVSHSHDHSHDHECCDHDHHDHHDHPHDHGHAHDHGHTHGPAAPAHGHDHGHDHGFSPWRYAVLLLPVVLYFLNLPNAGFSSDYLERSLAPIELDSSRTENVADKGAGIEDLGFKDLVTAAAVEDRRTELAGRTVRLRGQFVPGNPDNTCRLARFTMVCCAADATPLNAVIVAPEPLTGHYKLGQWVEVTGQVQFRKRKDRDEYLPVLQVKSREAIQPIEPEANPYLQ